MFYYPLFLIQGEIPIKTVRSEVFGDLWITRSFARKHIRSNPVVIQSALNIRRPWEMCSSNYRTVARVIKNTPVRSFLMVGMGIGAVFHAVKRYWPDARLTGIEKDPVIAELAYKEFNLPREARVFIGDALDVLAGLREKFDFILIDVFDGTYPPAVFFEKRTLELVSERLTPGGIVCMNTARKHLLDRRYFKLKRNFSEVFSGVKEIESLEGKVLPVLPHNVVLVGRR